MAPTARRSLLIFHQGALGDFVAVFPLLLQLRKKFPQIDVACQLEVGKLAKALRIADHYFPSEAAYMASLFSDRPDPKLIGITGSYDTVLLFSFSEALEQSLRKMTGRRVVRITPRPEPELRRHIMHHVLEQLKRIGFLEPDAPIPSAASWRCPGISSSTRPEEKKRILLHPGAGSKRKCWPINNFAILAEKLMEKDLQPEFLLGPAEYDVLVLLQKAQGVGHIVHTPPDTDSLLKLLKASAGFIGNDSGVSHLAAFIGLPTLVVFGPSDPLKWQPTGRSVKIVRSASDCLPCFETRADVSCADVRCLTDTSTGDVLQAFEMLLSENN